jgi:hypothetical protein
MRAAYVRHLWVSPGIGQTVTALVLIRCRMALPSMSVRFACLHFFMCNSIVRQ